MVLFETIIVKDLGMTPFQRAICSRLFTVETIPKPVNAKVTVGTLVSIARRFGGIVVQTGVRIEGSVFTFLGLNSNLVSRVLFYGAVAYGGSYVVGVCAPFGKNIIVRAMGAIRGAMFNWTLKWRKPGVRVGTTMDSSIVMESARPGSVEQPMIAKSFQLPVGYMDGSVFVAMGWCVRVHNYLVMPEHVIAAISAMDSGKYVWIRSGTKAVVKQDVSRAEYPDTDLALIKLQEVDFSILGLSKVVIEHVLSEVTGETVTICGLDGKGTTGTLRHSPMFGMVVYDATTKNGYSGSPYVKGSRVLGIHLYGGKVNMGYSMSYINILISQLEHNIGESSEDFIEKVVKKSGRKAIRLFNVSGGQDEVQMRVNGRYHTFQLENVTKALGAGWFDDIEIEPNGNAERYMQAKRDACFECRAPEPVGFCGASSISNTAINSRIVAGANQTNTSTGSTAISKRKLKLQKLVQQELLKHGVVQ